MQARGKRQACGRSVVSLKLNGQMQSFPEAAVSTGSQAVRSPQVDWESVREVDQLLGWKAPLWIASGYLDAWAPLTLVDNIRDSSL